MGDSCFLFANPSFIGGMASVLDLGSTLVAYNRSPSGSEADGRAIMSDWRNTGKDIAAAIDQTKRELNGQT